MPRKKKEEIRLCKTKQCKIPLLPGQTDRCSRCPLIENQLKLFFKKLDKGELPPKLKREVHKYLKAKYYKEMFGERDLFNFRKNSFKDDILIEINKLEETKPSEQKK
jgi:hypothetical protein